MDHLTTSLYTAADQLHEIDTIDLEQTEYHWDGEEYATPHQLLDESDLTDGAPQEDQYSALIDTEIGEQILKQGNGEIDAQIISDEGTARLTLPDGEAASVFYNHQRKRGQYVLDSEPSENHGNKTDDKREYVLHDEPVLTIDSDTNSFGLLLFGREKGSAPCQYIDQRFPGDLIYLEGTTTVDPDELDTLKPDTEQAEPASDTEGLGDDLEEMYRQQIADQPLDYQGYKQFANELAENIQTLEQITDTMQAYFTAKAADEGMANEQRHHEDPETYQHALETQLTELKHGYSDIQEAIKTTDLGTHRALPLHPDEDGPALQIDDDSALKESWVDRLKTEQPQTYTTLHDTHQLAESGTTKVLDSVRPKLQPGPDGEQRVDPAMMLAQIDMQGFDAVDEYIETVLEQEETWDGNETTDMMFS